MNDLTPTNGLPFDLSSVGLAVETGRPMILRHPATGAVLRNQDGSPVSILLLGQYSETFRVKMRAIQLNRPNVREQLKREIPNFGDNDPLPVQAVEDEDTELVCACTCGWTIEQLDGQRFEFSPENARKLWWDPRFAHYRAAALGFIMGDRNFFGGSTGS